MPSSIGIEPAFHGAICPSATATGRRHTSASGDGAKAAYLGAFSGFWRLMRTQNICRSTRPAFGRISTAPAPKKGGEDQAIGRSRGGLTTKIHAIVDALGNPVALSLTPGQAADITQAAPLLDQVEPAAFLADKGYDADALIETLEERGITPVIPPKANRRMQRKTDFALYREQQSRRALLLPISSNTEPSRHATTSSPTLSLPPSRWFAYCSGSTDDKTMERLPTELDPGNAGRQMHLVGPERAPSA